MTYSIDYLAGFFDGEGSIYAYCDTPKGMVHPFHRFYVSACNTDRRPVDEFVRRFGGTFVADHKSGGRTRTKYNFVLTGRDRLAAFVKAMEGHLIVKAPQLDILRRYLIETHDGRSAGRGGLSQEEVDLRASLSSELATLNRRSPRRPVKRAPRNA